MTMFSYWMKSSYVDFVTYANYGRTLPFSCDVTKNDIQATTLIILKIDLLSLNSEKYYTPVVIVGALYDYFQHCDILKCLSYN